MQVDSHQGRVNQFVLAEKQKRQAAILSLQRHCCTRVHKRRPPLRVLGQANSRRCPRKGGDGMKNRPAKVDYKFASNPFLALAGSSFITSASSSANPGLFQFLPPARVVIGALFPSPIQWSEFTSCRSADIRGQKRNESENAT